jgi:hypothetical protein
MLTNAGPTIVVGTRTQGALVFLPPPLKFRTAGFPRYGFKREVRTATFATRRGDLYAALAPALAPCGPEGHVCYWAGAVLRSALVHRPLARQRVLLSRQVFAYYGLIRASRFLPPIYALDDGSLPFLPIRAGNERVPNLLCLSLSSVPPSVPRQTRRLLMAVASSSAVAFPISVVGRPLHLHALRFQRGPCNEAAKFALCYGPDESLAPHRPGHLRSSFHLLSHLKKASNITTRVNQPIPAAGLTPAR